MPPAIPKKGKKTQKNGIFCHFWGSFLGPFWGAKKTTCFRRKKRSTVGLGRSGGPPTLNREPGVGRRYTIRKWLYVSHPARFWPFFGHFLGFFLIFFDFLGFLPQKSIRTIGANWTPILCLPGPCLDPPRLKKVKKMQFFFHFLRSPLKKPQKCVCRTAEKLAEPQKVGGAAKNWADRGTRLPRAQQASVGLRAQGPAGER